MFAALCSYVHLQALQVSDVIDNIYRLRQDLFKEVVASFIQSFIPDKGHINPQFRNAVNA
jgi:hypothetical protein